MREIRLVFIIVPLHLSYEAIALNKIQLNKIINADMIKQ